MSFVTITNSDFKNYFVRDFPYGTNIDLHVLDADLDRAIAESFSEINQSIFEDQTKFDTALKYLSAHYLVMNIRDSGLGLSGQFEWSIGSKGVGSVSTSFQIPSSISENPKLAHLAKSTYGARYVSIIYPLLVGQVFVVGGGTQA